MKWTTNQINFSDTVSVSEGINFLRRREGEVKIINVIYINQQLIIHYLKKEENGK